jgi:hypothetical protein
MLMRSDHSLQEISLWKRSIVLYGFRKWKFIKEFTGIQPIRIPSANLIALPVQRVKEIQAMNKKGIKVDRLQVTDDSWNITPVSQDLLKNNSLTRFDPPDNKGKSKPHQNKRKNRRFNDKRVK